MNGIIYGKSHQKGSMQMALGNDGVSARTIWLLSLIIIMLKGEGMSVGWKESIFDERWGDGGGTKVETQLNN